MESKITMSNLAGILLLSTVLLCVLIGVQPAAAQWGGGGGVSIWCTQQYYSYGQEIYLIIFTQFPLHRARLEIRQWGGPDYRMDIGHLWPGQYQIDAGTSSPPPGMVRFVLFDGWQPVARTSCMTGP